MSTSDRGLGLDRRISRRDFLDGMLVSGAGLLAPGGQALAARSLPYPPALTGLRGSHAGAFEALHDLVGGGMGSKAPAAVSTNETYDLVIVGAGISGLAAAHAYRKARPRASVLVLDNHDDFGGHAKRNEFTAGKSFRIGHGGTQSIGSPAPYSKQAKALIAELGVKVERYPRYAHRSLYQSLGLGPAFYFDRETFGADRLLAHRGRAEYDAEFIANAPLSDAAKRDATRLTTERFDPYSGETLAAKRAKLARQSYLRFLTDVWKIDTSVIPLLDTRAHGLYGVGIDAVPAQDATGLGFPGFQGMDLGAKPGPGQNLDSIRSDDAADYFFHFPDGNATLARLLVQRLIPAAMAGRTVADAVTAKVNYGCLDCPGEKVRIRLNSPVVRVRHLGAPADARLVEVVYHHGGGQGLTGKQNAGLKTVTAKRVILACWHTMIPYICSEFAPEQRDALAYGIKIPVVYTNVMLRNWTAFQRLGVSRITCPSFWHTSVTLDFAVSMGGYRFPQSPEEPIVVRLTKAACRPGLPARDQHRAGRRELYETSFEQIERSIREQLNRLLGPGGFDAARDILGITVNRWPHGYSYQYNSLFDDFWLEGKETPCEIARRPFGRITIANADAGAYAYTDAAIDHGLRAAREALSLA